MAKRIVSRKAANITLWVAVVILILSIVVLILFPTIYKNELKKDISLADGSLVSKFWRDIPLPIYEKIYFFNITNAEEFLTNQEPLNVTQVGPYTYQGKWTKRHPHWNSNGTVSYRELRTYHFSPELSSGTQEDEIYTLNGPMIVATNIIKDYNFWLKLILSVLMGIEGESIIIKKTIRELTYEGYEDPIIKYAPIIKQDLPFKDGRFLWLYDKNATDDGLFTVFTGVDDASKTNFIDKWNGLEKLPFWKGDTCNMMNGTSIETGPPIHDDQDTYTFFQTIFCRSLTFNYSGEIDHHDVLSKRFKATYEVFANGSENPDNYCYDLQGTRPSGVLDVSPCQFGAPIFLSFPHFHLADPTYLKSINGLSPDAEKHGSHVDAEPITGMSVDASIKFQINMQISRDSDILQFRNVPEGIFPVFWIDLSFGIDQNYADFLRHSLKNPKIIAYSILGVLVFLCLILIIACAVILRISKEDDDDPLINVEEDKDSSLKKQDNEHKVVNYGTYCDNPKVKQPEETNHTIYSGATNKALDLSSDVGYSGTESAEIHDSTSPEGVNSNQNTLNPKV